MTARVNKPIVKPVVRVEEKPAAPAGYRYVGQRLPGDDFDRDMQKSVSMLSEAYQTSFDTMEKELKKKNIMIKQKDDLIKDLSEILESKEHEIETLKAERGQSNVDYLNESVSGIANSVSNAIGGSLELKKKLALQFIEDYANAAGLTVEDAVYDLVPLHRRPPFMPHIPHIPPGGRPYPHYPPQLPPQLPPHRPPQPYMPYSHAGYMKRD